jgi:hypothetical protein
VWCCFLCSGCWMCSVLVNPLARGQVRHITSFLFAAASCTRSLLSNMHICCRAYPAHSDLSGVLRAAVAAGRVLDLHAVHAVQRRHVRGHHSVPAHAHAEDARRHGAHRVAHLRLPVRRLDWAWCFERSEIAIAAGIFLCWNPSRTLSYAVRVIFVCCLCCIHTNRRVPVLFRPQ